VIEVLTGLYPGQSELLEQAFQLRHDIFVDERKWTELARPDRREVDQFDGPHAVYLLAVVQGQVVGHQRNLPTTRPHLLSEVHPHLCARDYARGPHIWEWTRFCVDQRYRSDHFSGKVAAELTIGAIEWGVQHGVFDVVLEYSPVLIPIFLKMGFEVRPLGLPTDIDGEAIVAVQMHYDESVLLRAKKDRQLNGSVLSYAAQERSSAPAYSRRTA
jgi:acyl-homoserine lactone synthase